jgi:hypothetical protein
MTIQTKISVAVAAIALVTALVASSSAPARQQHRHHRARHAVVFGGTETTNTVRSGGQYVGHDPDARLRGQLLNDFNRGVTFPGGH